jgi:hypothetical protein
MEATMKRSTMLRSVALGLLVAGCSSEASSGSNDESTASGDDAITSSSSAVGSITDDSYVSSEYPANLAGGATYLKVGTAGPNLHHTYVKLDVTSIIAGATNISAKLTLRSLDNSGNAVHAHCGNASNWDQTSLDWTNQPGFAAADVASVGSLAANTDVTFDVSSCVKGNGAATVVLDQPTGAVAEFASLESANKPKLAVTFTPPVAKSSQIFGMFNNTAIPPGTEVNSGSNYRIIADKWMDGSKMKVHRVYNSTLPVSYAKSGGADDPANGNVSFLSVKPPSNDIAGVAAGKYDSEIAALAATIPAGSYFTMYHEPEDNMTGPQFTAMFRQFYKIAKGANSKISIGYVAMAFQWRPGSASTANEDSWYPGADSTDFLGADAYDEGFQGAHSLDTAADFQRWYAWAKAKNKPMVIPEYGVESSQTGGFSDSERATILTGTMNYLQTQPEIKMVLYWNSTPATPGGAQHILNPTTSTPADDFPLARAAWNAGVAKLGSTGTSF